MKKKLLALIAKREEARAALVTKSEASKDVAELRSINGQLEALNTELKELRDMAAAMPDDTPEKKSDPEMNPIDQRTQTINTAAGSPEKTAAAPVQTRSYNPAKGFVPAPGGGIVTDEERTAQNKKDAEKRGKELMEGRSITVASGSIVLPKVASSTINGTFVQVSGLLDRVDQLMLSGGESFTQPYEKGTPDGNYTDEGTAPGDTDVVFGYADISKTKITAYSEITNEIRKLPAADYESVVMQGITRSARKKLAKEILIGTGATGHLTGILTDAATAIDASTDISLATITNTTLNEIIFGYGGDEAVEEQATLILNKLDLKAFSQLRTTDGKPFHTIVTHGNTGTIDGIPYIINSAAGAISKAATAAGAYCMAYGVLTNYKLVVFSDLDVQRSTDYKFKEGMIAHRGEVYAGGNVVSYNGFVRVKKASAA
jgi:HK97 family phage major capsid protein